jgi:hypothetical protein
LTPHGGADDGSDPGKEIGRAPKKAACAVVAAMLTAIYHMLNARKRG